MERLNSLWGVMAILLWVSIISVQSHANPQAPFSVSPDGGGNNVPLNAAQQQYRQQEQKQQDKIRQQLSQQQQHNRQQQLNQQQQETLNQQQPTLNQQQPTLNQQQQRNHQQQRPNIPVPGSIPRPGPNIPVPGSIPRPSQQSVNGVPNVVPIRRPNQRPIPGPLAINTRRRVEDTQVQCLKTHMMVTFRFSEPFNGFIYPHKQFAKCLLFRGQNSLEASMQLKHGTCGDQENKIVFRGKSFLDPVIEHRLMVQWERDIVSEDDSTVIVRCDRPDDFNKTIEWKFGTRELSATLERSQHPGPKMWMEIQRGEGPTAPPLGTDPIYIGDVMTLVFTLSDNVYWFDSNIFTCHALDGGQERQQIEWDTTDTAASSQSRDFSGQSTVIENGCSVKPKLFSHFFKERNTMPNGDLVTLHYGHFKAFRFPSSMRVVLQCDVQVCYKECPSPDPCSEAFHPRLAEEQTTRRRREAESTDDEAHEIDRVEMFRTLEILLAEEGGEQRIPVNSQILQGALEEYCYSPTVYYTTVIALVCIIVFLIILVAVIFLRGKMHSVSFFSPTKNVK